MWWPRVMNVSLRAFMEELEVQGGVRVLSCAVTVRDRRPAGENLPYGVPGGRCAAGTSTGVRDRDGASGCRRLLSREDDGEGT